MVQALGELGAIPSPIWQHIFGVIGGAIVGGTAIATLKEFPMPRPVPRQTRPGAGSSTADGVAAGDARTRVARAASTATPAADVPSVQALETNKMFSRIR